GTTFGWLIAGVVVASAIECVSDVALNSIVPVLRGTGSATSVVRSIGWIVFAATTLCAPIIAVLAYSYINVSQWTIVLFLLPALAAQRLFILYQRQREATEELENLNGRLERANLSFASALVATLDARDRYTAGHSAAVAIYARDIAAQLGLTVE